MFVKKKKKKQKKQKNMQAQTAQPFIQCVCVCVSVHILKRKNNKLNKKYEPCVFCLFWFIYFFCFPLVFFVNKCVYLFVVLVSQNEIKTKHKKL